MLHSFTAAEFANDGDAVIIKKKNNCFLLKAAVDQHLELLHHNDLNQQHFYDRHTVSAMCTGNNTFSRKTEHVILPVNTLDHNENFLPGSVGSGLPVYDGISEKFLQALHVYDT